MSASVSLSQDCYFVSSEAILWPRWTLKQLEGEGSGDFDIQKIRERIQHVPELYE